MDKPALPLLLFFHLCLLLHQLLLLLLLLFLQFLFLPLPLLLLLHLLLFLFSFTLSSSFSVTSSSSQSPVLLFLSPVAVVAELVVAGEGDKHAEPDAQREADLRRRLDPDLVCWRWMGSGVMVVGEVRAVHVVGVVVGCGMVVLMRVKAVVVGDGCG
jgi:hypothetical protein